MDVESDSVVTAVVRAGTASCAVVVDMPEHGERMFMFAMKQASWKYVGGFDVYDGCRCVKWAGDNTVVVASPPYVEVLRLAQGQFESVWRYLAVGMVDGVNAHYDATISPSVSADGGVTVVFDAFTEGELRPEFSFRLRMGQTGNLLSEMPQFVTRVAAGESFTLDAYGIERQGWTADDMPPFDGWDSLDWVTASQ